VSFVTTTDKGHVLLQVGYFMTSSPELKSKKLLMMKILKLSFIMSIRIYSFIHQSRKPPFSNSPFYRYVPPVEKGMKLLHQYYNMPGRLTLIKNIIFTIIGISLFTYKMVVKLPLLKGQHGKKAR
jgi:hypothetical protein